MEPGELAAWLRLVLTPGIGPATARALLAAFGLPQQVFTRERSALLQVLGPAQADALMAEPADLPRQLDATLEWLDGGAGAQQRRILTLADGDYPPALLETEDPPLMLHVAGPRHLACGRALAVVGSRNPTPQGLENALRFSQTLAQAEVTVVSGLALGVDGAAHEGALAGAASGQLATIAVVGTGLDRVYPRRHLDLARRIAERGWLVSEYLVGTPPLAPNFPRRNRIIAALSEGTLVVEAALQSGSLITARLAAEQGRDVFAIPGSIHSPQSRGCHALIRQGAKLVESAQDVLEELRWPPDRAVARGDAGARPSGAEDGALLEALGFDPTGLDALIARTGIAAAQLQAQLLELELAGQVARLAGGMYQRIDTA